MILNVNITGIDAIRSQFAKLGKAPAQALAITAEKIEDYIHAQTKPHTLNSARVNGSKARGGLESSLVKKRLQDGSWEIGHDSRVAPYARFVHDGTRPHLILPKNKKALRWASGGLFHFSKKGVRHPGTKPDKWMDRAAAQAPMIFKAALERELSKRT